MLAFSIALLLDMPRPYWAMASVYITSNQFTGATRSKAVYRIVGTLIGAAGTIVLVPNLANAPELLSFGIALWVGIFLYLSLIDGTPRSYVFMWPATPWRYLRFRSYRRHNRLSTSWWPACRKSRSESSVRAWSRRSCCRGASPRQFRHRRTPG